MKTSLIVKVLLTISLLLAMASAVWAKPANPGAIACELDISFNGAFWLGTLSGDQCTVAGAIRFDSVDSEYRFRPNEDNLSTMHFVEIFSIWPGSEEPDGEPAIKGKNCGLWNFSTFKYRAHGWVTEASGDWADLVGAQYHEMGITTDPADGIPLLAPDGRAKLVPGKRPVDSPETLCAPPEK